MGATAGTAGMAVPRVTFLAGRSGTAGAAAAAGTVLGLGFDAAPYGGGGRNFASWEPLGAGALYFDRYP